LSYGCGAPGVLRSVWAMNERWSERAESAAMARTVPLN
jgi:hypothetical protein